jgi:hypothetical protein
VTIESGVSAAAVRPSLVVEQWLGLKPPRPESCRQCTAGSHCAYWLIPPVRQNLVCMVCGAGRGSCSWCSRGAFGQDAARTPVPRSW